MRDQALGEQREYHMVAVGERSSDCYFAEVLARHLHTHELHAQRHAITWWQMLGLPLAPRLKLTRCCSQKLSEAAAIAEGRACQCNIELVATDVSADG